MSTLALTLLLVVGAMDAGTEAGTATPDDVQVRVTPGQVKLGEPFVYELVIRHGKDERYELVTESSSLGNFELLSLDRRREDGPDSATTTFRLTLSAFALGEQTLPELPLEVTRAGGKLRYVPPAAKVELVSTLPEEADGGVPMKPLKPPEEARVRSWAALWILFGVGALAVLAWLAARYLRHRRQQPAPAPPPVPLEVRTLEALQSLAAQNLPAQGRGREFYFRLSEIVRGYLGERYGFEALECTSSELRERAARLQDRTLPLDDLNAFVSRSDMVKYARGAVSAADSEQELAFAVRLVQLTTPPPPAPGNADAR